MKVSRLQAHERYPNVKFLYGVEFDFLLDS